MVYYPGCPKIVVKVSSAVWLNCKFFQEFFQAVKLDWFCSTALFDVFESIIYVDVFAVHYI